MTKNSLPLLSLFAWIAPGAAQAYVGPGAGISAIGSLLALLGAVLLAVVGFVWYPLKRIARKRRTSRGQADSSQQDD